MKLTDDEMARYQLYLAIQGSRPRVPRRGGSPSVLWVIVLFVTIWLTGMAFFAFVEPHLVHDLVQWLGSLR